MTKKHQIGRRAESSNTLRTHGGGSSLEQRKNRKKDRKPQLEQLEQRVLLTSATLPLSLPGGDNVYWENIDSQPGLGFNVGDAYFGNPDLSDAYDDIFQLRVNGNLYTPSTTVDLQDDAYGLTITAETVNDTSGLDVRGQFTAFKFGPVIRALQSFTNPTANPITVSVNLGGDLGSNGGTTIEGTSSGDNLFDTADRWSVSSDGAPISDPVNGFVYYGPGSPSEIPTAASLVTETLSVDFSLTVPGNSTQHLMYFAQLSGTIADGLAEITDFDTNASVNTAGYLSGLTTTELGEIVNWDSLPTPGAFPNPTPAPGTSTETLPLNLTGTDLSYWSGFDTDPTDGFTAGESFTGQPARDEGFDQFWGVQVGGTVYAPSDTVQHTVTADTQSLTALPQTISNLNVEGEFTVFRTGPEATLRSVTSFSNPTGAPITVTVATGGNLGSDANTVVNSTSSGDTALDTSDRWIVTTGSVGNTPNPATATVLFGAGSPISTPTSSQFSSLDTIATEFSVTVPANATRRLMFFSQIEDDPTALETQMQTFGNDTATANAGFFRGMSQADLAEVVNWTLGNPIITADDPGGNGQDNAADDQFRIVRNGGDVEVYIDGNFSRSFPWAGLDDITVQGSDDNDSLIVDLSGGDTVPTGGIFFNGGSGTDSMSVTGNTTPIINQVFDYTGDSPGGHDGTIDLDGNTITFTGLEPLTGTDSVNTTFFLPDVFVNADVVLQNNAATSGSSELTGSTFEDTIFPNPSASLTINLGDLGDTLTVDALDSGFAAALTLTGGTSGDDITVNTMTGNGNLLVSGASGADTLTIMDVAAGINIVDAGSENDLIEISIDAAGPAENVFIFGGSETDQLSAIGTAGIDVFDLNLEDGDLNDNIHFSQTETIDVDGAGFINFLDINFTDGNDTVVYTPSAGELTLTSTGVTEVTTVTLDNIDDDMFLYGRIGTDSIRVVDNTGSLIVASFDRIETVDDPAIQYVDFESASLTGNITQLRMFMLTGGTTTITTGSSTTEGTYQIEGGLPVFFADLVGDIDVTGSTNNDTLVFDHSGTDLLAGQINFDGGDPTSGSGDRLEMQNGDYGLIVHDLLGPDNGEVDADGTVLTYTGLEPVLINVGSVDDIEFNLPAGMDTVSLGDDVTLAGRSEFISQTGAFESTQFTNPGTSLTINDTSGAKQFDLNTPDAAFGADVVLDAGDGNDQINVRGTTGNGFSYTLDGGDDNDTFAVGDSGLLDPVGPELIDVIGGSGTDLLTVDDSASTGDNLYTIVDDNVGRNFFQSIDYATIEQLDLFSGSGEDTVEIDSTLTTTPVDVNTSDGEDIITLGNGTFLLDDIRGTVTVDGGADDDFLDILDFNSTASDIVLVTNSAVTGISPADINYSQIEELNVDSSDTDATTFSVVSTPQFASIDTGAGDDFLRIGNGTLDNIGELILTDFNGGPDNDTLIYDDSLDPDTVMYTLGSDGDLARDGLDPHVDVDEFDDLYENVILFAGTGENIIDVTPGNEVEFFIDGGTPTAVLPGDTLNIDLNGVVDPVLEIIPTLTGGIGMFTFGGGTPMPVNFTDIETINPLNAVGLDLVIREDLSPDFADNDADDTTRLALDGLGAVVVEVNGIHQFAGLFTAYESITVIGSSDNDTLDVDNSNGFVNPSGGITYNGGIGSTGSVDQLIVQGGVAVNETYLATGPDSGIVLIDPDGSAGRGATAFVDDEQVITFFNLTPVLTTSTVTNHDILLTNGGDNVVTIADGGVLLGFQTTVVAGATFEDVWFANKTNVTVNGLDGFDVFSLDNPNAAVGLTNFTVFGDADVVLPQASDDGEGEVFIISQTGATVASTTLNGQGGNDLFTNEIVSPTLGGGGHVDGVVSPLTIEGGMGDDVLLLTDENTVLGANNSTLTDSALTDYAAAPINYANVEAIDILMTPGNDLLDVESTNGLTDGGLNGPSTYFVSGLTGNDVFIVSNFGSLDGILGPIQFAGDEDRDTLIIDDTLDPDGDIAAITEVGGGRLGSLTELTGFAPATISYTYTTTGLEMEVVGIGSSAGADIISVNDTTASQITTVFGSDDNDIINVNADNLSANNQINGADGTDTVNLNVTVDLGNASVFPLTSLVINGADPDHADPATRDIVNVFDNSGAARDHVFQYPGGQGNLNINPGLGGGFAIPVNITTVEQTNYFGTGVADTVTIEGTPGDDTLSVTPLTDTSANVFLNGDPLLTIPPDTADTNNPGVADGGMGPDINLNGLAQSNGLTVQGGGFQMGGAGDRIVVNATTENLGIGTPAASGWDGFPDAGADGNTDIAPAGASTVRATGEAYDDIFVDESVVRISNNIVLSLIDVNMIAASFARTNPDEAEVTVNTGEEAGVRVNNVADDITVQLSVTTRFQINGGEPPLPGAAPIAGDRLNLLALPDGNFNIYSDAANDNNTQVAPNDPNVKITSSVGSITSAPVGYESIELVLLRPDDATQEVNILGDDNGANPGQQDEIIVSGQDVDSNLSALFNDDDSDGQNEFYVLINGSNPIGALNTRFLNILSAGGADDITIDPYADDTTGGWDIDVRVDGGTGDDDVIYGNVEGSVDLQGVSDLQPALPLIDASPDGGQAGVSENIVVAPTTTAGAGQIRVTNASDGTNIVTLDFVNVDDLSIYVNDGSAGDTDSVTFLGTGEDDQIGFDLTQAGTEAEPIGSFGTNTTASFVIENIQVATAAGPRIATLNPIANINIAPGDGDDTFTVQGSNAGSTSFNFIGGPPNGSDDIVVPGTLNANDTFRLIPGPTNDAGEIRSQVGGATAATITTYSSTETIEFQGGTGTGTDSLTIEGTSGNDTFGVSATASGAGTVEFQAAPDISFNGFGVGVPLASELAIEGLGGSDILTVTHNTNNWQLATVDFDGGGGSDIIEVVGTLAASDTLTYSASAADAGDLTITTTGGTQTYDIDTTESIRVDGLGNATGGDILRVTTVNAVITELGAPGSGVVEPFNLAGAPLLPLVYMNIENVAVTGTTAVVEGTAEDDTISLSASGIITITNSLGFSDSVDVSGFDAVVINALGGDDQITIAPSAVFDEGVTVIGGENGDGSDSLTINDQTLSVNFGNSTITGVVVGSVSFTGIETLNINGSDDVADSVTVQNYGAPTGVEHFNISGGDDGTANAATNNDGDIINISLATTLNSIKFISQSVTSATVRRLQGGPDVVVTDFNSAANGLSITGSGNIDDIDIIGTLNGDTIAATSGGIGTSVAIRPGATAWVPVDFTAFELLTISSGLGDDTVTLNGTSVEPIVNGGEGDDSISAVDVTATTVTLLGGDGEDTLVGSENGEAGDLLDGGAGNDQLEAGLGNDTMLGGDDSDLMIWRPGDGSDLIEGGSGQDELEFNGNTAANIFEVLGNGTRLAFVLNTTQVTMDVAGVETVDINGAGGADRVVVNDLSRGTDLSNTEVQFVDIDLSTVTSSSDVVVNGRTTNDDIAVTVQGSVVDIAGLAYDIRITNAEDTDELTVNGNTGNDTITAAPGVENTIDLNFSGGLGDDLLSGSGTLTGGAGNDTLIGQASGDSMAGGAGNDSLVGQGGNDNLAGGTGDDTLTGGTGTNTLDGGAGFDVIPVEGNGAANNIDIDQTGAVLTIAVGSVSGTNTISNIELLDVTGGTGNDTVTATGVDIPTHVDAGDGNDTVTLETLAANATVLGGDGNDTINAAAVTSSTVQVRLSGNDGNDSLVGADQTDGAAIGDSLFGGAGDDTLEGGRGRDYFFGEADSDLFIWVAGDGSDLMEGGTGTDELNFIANDGGTLLELLGGGLFTTTLSGFFSNGVLQDSSRAIFALNTTQVFLNLGQMESVDIDAFGGADQIIINNQSNDTSENGSTLNRGTDLSATTIQAIDIDLGGSVQTPTTLDAAADNVEVNGGLTADNISITAQTVGTTTTIDVAGFDYSIRIHQPENNIDTLFVHGHEGNDTINSAIDVESSIQLELNGGAGDDLLESGDTLNGDGGNDTLIGRAGNDSLSGGTGNDVIIGGGGTDSISGGLGGDTIHVTGTPGNDTITATFNTSGNLVVNDGTVTTTYLGINGAGIERLLIESDDGDDTINVVYAANAPNVNVVVDGDGSGAGGAGTVGDTLNVTVLAAARITQAAVSTTGTIDQTGTGQVDYSAIESISITSSSTDAQTLTVRATDDDDTIAAATIGTNDIVWVNDGPAIVLAGFSTLDLHGRFGDDHFSITPIDGVNITAQGMDPSASDTVVIQAGANTDYTPGSQSGGVVTVTGANPVTLQTVESLTINGLDADITLTVTGDTGDESITVTPSDEADAAHILVTTGTSTLLPVTALDLGRSGGITIDGAGGTDGITYLGTGASDSFTIVGTASISQNNRISLGSTNVESYTLNGLGGDDLFTITPISGISVDVNGDETTADQLSLIAQTTAASGLNLATGIFGQSGFGSVSYSGVEHISLNANGTATTITATAGDDTVVVTPLTGTTGTLVLNGSTPTVGYLGIASSALAVDLGGGQDELIVEGNETSETITVNGSAVTTSSQTVTGTNGEAVRLNANQGNDDITVTPGSIPIFIDGGDPVGVVGDTLILNANTTLTHIPGPENDEGGFVIDGQAPVSFDHIEAITVNDPDTQTPLAVTLCGTNGDDDITVLGNGANAAAVTINDGPVLTFSSLNSLTIEGKNGDDQFDLDVNGLDLTTFTVEGGLPSTTGDEVTFTGNGGNASWSPSSQDAGSLQATADQAIGLVGIENLIYDGENTNSTLTVNGSATAATNETFTHTPGTDLDSGSIGVVAGTTTMLGISYVNLGGTGTASVNGMGGADTLVAFGEVTDDAFTVAATTGAITHARPAGNHVAISSTNVETLSLHGIGSDDTFTMNSPLPYTTINIQGGDPGASDVLTFNGQTNTNDAYIVQPGFNTGAGAVTQNVNTTFNYTSIEHLQFNGSTGTNTLEVRDDGADNNWSLKSGPGTGDRIEMDSRETVDFTSFTTVTLRNNSGEDVFAVHPTSLTGATNHVVTGNGDDELQIHGTGDDDGLNSGPGTSSTGIAGANSVNVQFSGIATVALFGDKGDDTTTVTPITDVRTVVEGDGPTASDTLIVNVSGSARVTQGAPSTSGAVTETGAGAIDYANIELMTINSATAASTLDVWATNDNDTIAVQPVGTTGQGRVWINDGTVITFNSAPTNFSALTVTSRFGSDSVSINPIPGIPITLTGGDPTNADTLVVNGTTGADTITYAPSASDAGTVQVNALGLVTFSTVESLDINGVGGTDTLNVRTPTGANNVTVTPGSTVDSGNVAVDSLLPVDFNNVGAAGNLTLTDQSGNRVDSLTYRGTDLNDTFGTAATTGAVTLNNQVQVNTPGITNLSLEGLNGVDTFNVNAVHPYNEIAANGQSSDVGDTLNLIDAAGRNATVVLDLANGTATGFGSVANEQVSFTGIENVSVDGVNGTDTLTAVGSNFDDLLEYTPTGPQSGRFTLDTSPVQYDFVNIAGTFTVQLNDTAGDSVTVNGTNNHDVITVDSPRRTVTVENAVGTVLKPVVLHSTVEQVTAKGGLGNDTFVVAPTTPVASSVDGIPSNLLIDIQGGFPGTSDALIVADSVNATTRAPAAFANASHFVVVNQSRQPDQGVVRVFEDNPTATPPVQLPDISYTNVEIVSPFITGFDPATGDPNLLILGPDNFEQNEFRANAAFLGSGSVLNVTNLALFPAFGENRYVPADEDWFRVVAQETGTLDFQVYFRQFSEELLPAGGDIQIEVYDVTGDLVSGFGTNESDPTDDDERVRIPAVAGQTYYLRVYGAPDGAPASAVVNGYDMTIINTATPVPYDIELTDIPVSPAYDCTLAAPANNTDTGRSQFDNHTCDSTPVIRFRLDDAILLQDLPGNPSPNSPPDQNIPIPFNSAQTLDTTSAGYRVAVYIEGSPQQPGQLPQDPIGFARMLSNGVYEFDFGADALSSIDPNGTTTSFTLTDGSHFISTRLQIIDPATPNETGYGARSDSLEIVVDTVVPPVTFGDPGSIDDGLHPDSDSGIINQTFTISDQITNDNIPTFFGTAEANSIIRLYVVIDDGGTGTNPADDTLILIGQTVATPEDGTNQFPVGEWSITSTIDLNDVTLLAASNGFLDVDGERSFQVTAEDLAGNVGGPDTLTIFLDTRGPRVVAVERENLAQTGTISVLEPKPTNEPAPLVDYIEVTFQDEPTRVDGFVYSAVFEALATRPGNYRLRGDANGRILISSVDFVDTTVANGVANTTVRLNFAAPLPDDRFTLTVYDRITDQPGNALDGDVQAEAPGVDGDLLPSGDGVPGDNFTARFTIDTRPEIGTFCCGSWYIDLNGNGVFDPENTDATNRDIVFHFGKPGDKPVVGNWSQSLDNDFDKVGVYGNRASGFFFELDLNGDGAFDPGVDARFQFGPNLTRGIPISGDWNGDGRDEIGLFDGTSFYLDLNGNFALDAGETIATNLRGRPVVGDWTGTGQDRVGVFRNRTFSLDIDGNYQFNAGDVRLVSGFGGSELPLADDFDGDGDDNVGLFERDRNGVLPRDGSEFYLDVGPTNSGPYFGTTGSPGDGLFQPPPTGHSGVPLVFHDIFHQFGDRKAEPIVGNFDPPPLDGSGKISDDHSNKPRRSTALDLGTLHDSESGRIEKARDRDYFYFTAEKNGKVDIDVTTPVSRLDSIVEIRNANGNLIKSDNDSGRGSDSKLTFTAKKGKRYVIAVRARTRTGPTSIGPYDLDVDYKADEFADTIKKAGQPLALTAGSSSIEGAINSRKDRDIIAFTAQTSGKLEIRVDDQNSPVDTVVRVLNARGRRITVNDNRSSRDTNSTVTLNVKAGRTYYIDIRSNNQMGDYLMGLDYLLEKDI